MRLRHRDILRRGVDPRHRPRPAARAVRQSSPAPQPMSSADRPASGVKDRSSPPQCASTCLADIAQPRRVQPVQHRRRSRRVPPILRHGAEMRGLRRRRSSCLRLPWPVPIRTAPPTTRHMARTMARIVMKFGGTSMAGIDRIRNVAARVKREVAAGHQVAVVVSAMAGETDRLVGFLPRGLRALRSARIRRRRLGGRAGDQRPAGDRAAGGGRARAQLARLAIADQDIRRARLRAHRRDRHGRARRRAVGWLRGGDPRVSRGSPTTAGSRRWGAAAPTPRRWRWRRR